MNSSARNPSRPNGGKPANGMNYKKRKHSATTSPSNSESQETPSSNASGGKTLSEVLVHPCYALHALLGSMSHLMCIAVLVKWSQKWHRKSCF